ncbi:MAG: PDZ domain-containing protein [Phycisphaerales bacterium]|nr:PDZ domain-containing protein [Phycisphaerales bacterium]
MRDRLITLSLCCGLSGVVTPVAVAQGQRAPGQRPAGIGVVPDLATVVKPKIDPDAVPPILWRGDLLPAPLQPAPEVVRLWSPEVIAHVRISSRVLEAVADLDARAFATREAASARLADPAIATEELFAVLVKGNLSDEQTERLLTVASEKVLSLPRGALGLRMEASGDLLNPGVIVVMLLPGLPAERVLKLGDRIEKIDGKPIALNTDLVEIIQSKMPGENVRLSVARQQRDERGKPKLDPAGGFVEDRIELEVGLTSATDLEKFEDRFPNQMRGAIVERRLLALSEAEARFRPATAKVQRPLLKPIPKSGD